MQHVSIEIGGGQALAAAAAFGSRGNQTVFVRTFDCEQGRWRSGDIL
jgi:hypothetical protein